MFGFFKLLQDKAIGWYDKKFSLYIYIDRGRERERERERNIYKLYTFFFKLPKMLHFVEFIVCKFV